MTSWAHRSISLRCDFFRQLTHLDDRKTIAWENSAEWSGSGSRESPRMTGDRRPFHYSRHCWRVPVAICEDRNRGCSWTHRFMPSRQLVGATISGSWRNRHVMACLCGTVSNSNWNSTLCFIVVPPNLHWCLITPVELVDVSLRFYPGLYLSSFSFFVFVLSAFLEAHWMELNQILAHVGK